MIYTIAAIITVVLIVVFYYRDKAFSEKHKVRSRERLLKRVKETMSTIDFVVPVGSFGVFFSDEDAGSVISKHFHEPSEKIFTKSSDALKVCLDYLDEGFFVIFNDIKNVLYVAENTSVYKNVNNDLVLMTQEEVGNLISSRSLAGPAAP